MPATLDALPVLFAQAAGANQGAGQYNLILFVSVAVFWFYMFMLRPQQKHDRLRKEMMSGLKKNDRVLTSAGIYGTVVSVDGEQDRVVLRIDDDRGVKVAFSRASVVRVFDGSEEKAKDKDRMGKEKAAETA